MMHAFEFIIKKKKNRGSSVSAERDVIHSGRLNRFNLFVRKERLRLKKKFATVKTSPKKLPEGFLQSGNPRRLRATLEQSTAAIRLNLSGTYKQRCVFLDIVYFYRVYDKKMISRDVRIFL